MSTLQRVVRQLVLRQLVRHHPAPTEGTTVIQTINLNYDGGLKVPPSISICENNRKSNKIMHCVEEKNSLIGSFKDRAIFPVSQLSYDGGITDR